MKSQVNFVYDIEDDPLDELKHWLFLENVRLQQERQELNDEKGKLQREKQDFERRARSHEVVMEMQEKKLYRQKDLFEKQWQIVEEELRRLAKDRDKLEKDKKLITREMENLKNLKNQAKATVSGVEGTFFVGVNSALSLKKRYRDLLKIYHPDNPNGDKTIILYINKEYTELKRKFGID